MQDSAQPSKAKTVMKTILSNLFFAIILVGVATAFVALGYHLQASSSEKYKQHLVEMDAMLTEQFPEYTFTDEMIKDLSCYTVSKPIGGSDRFCYEPVSEGHKRYGAAEIIDAATGELVFVQLVATKDGPVLLSHTKE